MSVGNEELFMMKICNSINRISTTYNEIQQQYFTGPALGENLEMFTKILLVCTSKKEDPFVCLHCLTELRHLLLMENCPLAVGGQLETWLPVLVNSKPYTVSSQCPFHTVTREQECKNRERERA